MLSLTCSPAEIHELGVSIESSGRQKIAMALLLDLQTARRWGALSAALGHDSADLMIAATALEHGITVVTRKASEPSVKPEVKENSP
jgi:predicted nucleic acid-binding protein